MCVCVCVCVCYLLQVSVAVLLDNFVSETSREKNAQHDLLVEEMHKLQKSTPHSDVVFITFFSLYLFECGTRPACRRDEKIVEKLPKKVTTW